MHALRWPIIHAYLAAAPGAGGRRGSGAAGAAAAPRPLSSSGGRTAPLGGGHGAVRRSLDLSARREAPLAARVSANEGANSGQRPDFDLAKAINLAAFSFESYDTPTVADEFLHSDGYGTNTAYLGRYFVQQRFEGLLRVTLISAQGLPARDAWGRSDPYAIVRVGESAHRSATKWTDLSPKWNEDFYLYVNDVAKQSLQLRVYNENVVLADNDLGFAMLPLAGLDCDGCEPRVMTLPLEGQGGGGTVTVRLSFEIFEEDDDESRLFGDPDEDGYTPSTLAAWRVLAKQHDDQHTLPQDFACLCFMENTKTDTQVWLYRNREKRQVVVSFRGTEQDSLTDVATDLNLTPSVFDSERAGAPGPGWVGLVMGTDEPLVHGGFLAAYDSLKSRLHGLVCDLVTDLGVDEDWEYQPWEVQVTGHSLGGALATLCALELAQTFEQWKEEGRYDGVEHGVVMYNFGSPRVGNTAFARLYDSAVPDTWRVVNVGDIVPTVPRLLGLRHVGGEVRLSGRGGGQPRAAAIGGGGGSAVSRAEIDAGEDCETAWPSVDDESGGAGEGSATRPGGGAGGAAAAGRAALSSMDLLGCDVKPLDIIPILAQEDGAIEQLVEAEMEILQQLQSGAAIEEHMEDYYYRTLAALALTAPGGVQGVAAEGALDSA